jgi:hypothetical protein
MLARFARNVENQQRQRYMVPSKHWWGKTGFRINASVLVRSEIIHSTWIGQQLLSKLKGTSGNRGSCMRIIGRD